MHKKSIVIAGVFVAFFSLNTFSDIKIACVGDSITAGLGLPKEKRATHSYPAVLTNLLGDGYDVKNMGASSRTLLRVDKKAWVKTGYPAKLNVLKPDIIIVKLGTNDSKLEHWKNKANFESDFNELIEEFRQINSAAKIYLCLPVPAFARKTGRLSNGSGISGTRILNEVIPLIKKVAEEQRLPLIDLNTPFVSHPEYFPDGVHPNEEGAAAIAQVVFKSIRPAVVEGEGDWPGKRSSFHSFNQYNFVMEGLKCRVVVPNEVAAGKPWIWRARFFGHEPQVDIALLKKGFHVAYVDVSNLFGSPEAVDRWNTFYTYLTENHGLDSKVVLEGMSRGGLIVYNWAVRNPDRVHCIYADAPVCDFKSWPAGEGEGKRRNKVWQQCLQAYGFNEKQALAWKGNPVDSLQPLAEAGVPLLHVVGDADKVVPVAENTAIIEARYKKLDGRIMVIHKEGVGHHPHSLEDPNPIVDFIATYGNLAALGIAENR
ncbi:MAG: GDSL-type esterase/lipase family protein [Pontiella sp.]